MIDIESQVFTAVKTALVSAVSGITVEAVPNYAPSKFPFVSLEEADNYVYLPSRDTSNSDNHANVMYEVNIFTNKQNGKKAQAKAILAIVDGVMDRLGFTKTVCTPLTLSDASMYRIAARYIGVVGKDNIIYRR